MVQKKADSVADILDRPVPKDIARQNEEYDRKMAQEQKRIDKEEEKKEEHEDIIQEFMKAGITSKDLLHAKKLDDMIHSPDPVEDMDIPMEQIEAATKVKSLYKKLNQIDKNKKELEI
jgi:hypothetical protein